jgi:replicative DNA helicase
MKTLNPKIRKLIDSLYEEISKNNDEINFEEVEKKTSELHTYFDQKKLSSVKKAEIRTVSEDSTQEDAIYPIGDLITDSIKRLEARSKDKSNRYFLTTGFDQLDQMIGGFEPGEVIVIGARTGMGKTALMLSMMNNITGKSNHSIGFMSLEFPTSHLMERIISSEAEVPITRLKKANLELADWNRIIDGIGNIKKRKIYIVDNPHFSVDNIKNVAERLVKDYGIRIMIIDYLQMIEPFSKKRNREQEISSVIREIKMLAKTLNLVIIITSQLNRSVELRAGIKRPYLSDLRDSGAIEEDTDKVIFIHRPEVYEILEDEKGNSLVGMASLIIAKNRSGPTGEIMLNFSSEYGKFKDIKTDPKAYGDISLEDLLDNDSPF